MYYEPLSVSIRRCSSCMFPSNRASQNMHAVQTAKQAQQPICQCVHGENDRTSEAFDVTLGLGRVNVKFQLLLHTVKLYKRLYFNCDILHIIFWFT